MSVRAFQVRQSVMISMTIVAKNQVMQLQYKLCINQQKQTTVRRGELKGQTRNETVLKQTAPKSQKRLKKGDEFCRYAMRSSNGKKSASDCWSREENKLV
jgi:hypothetical protein